ncbi:hypothetical protein Tco_0036954, partial [Tanacetum coccineum]
VVRADQTPNVNRKNWNAMMERELGEGYSFTKKKCFVCGSLSQLIKDCDYYEKKIAREAEVKKQRVFNTDLDSRYLPGHQTALVLKDRREIGDLLLRPHHVIIGETLAQTPIVIVDQLLLELTRSSISITIPPLSQPAPPTPIAETTTASPSPTPIVETTNASPSPTPSPAHEPMEHTFEQPSTDQR